MPRGSRIARGSELRRCLSDGRRRRGAHLELIWLDNASGHARMGMIVPRFQFTAVARNRLRRRIREIWRREMLQGQPAVDLVVRARRDAYQAPFGVLRKELLAWLEAVAK